MLFWGVPWACTNHPPNHHELSPSLQNIIMPPGKGPEWHRVVVMGQKGQIYKMPDARCQNSEISAAVPPASASTHEAESQRRCSSMKS